MKKIEKGEKITMHKLAEMINTGFNDAKVDVKQINDRLDKVDERLKGVEETLSEDFRPRLRKLENIAGIE